MRAARKTRAAMARRACHGSGRALSLQGALGAALLVSAAASAQPAGHHRQHGMHGPGHGTTAPKAAKPAPRAATASPAGAHGAQGSAPAAVPASAPPSNSHGAGDLMNHGTGHDAHQGTGRGAAPAADRGRAPDSMPGAAPARAADTHMHTDMDAMMKSMQGGPAPPDARDPDAYAGGLEPRPMPGMDMSDHETYTRLLVDRLEAWRSPGGGGGQLLDAQAWWGGDIHKLWFKLDGERSDGRLGATRAEALWSRAIAPFWDLQAGLRHDFGGGPGRDWVAFGVQGLAPYWFEVHATAYAGPGGRTALRLEAEYELLFTQRLILQPLLKANVYGRNDPERGIGSGLSSVEAGLRLRYEFSRKFAPYLGVAWDGKFGGTAAHAREAGEHVRHTRWVAGVRMWY